jgi:hypothetical protein
MKSRVDERLPELERTWTQLAAELAATNALVAALNAEPKKSL